MKRKLILTLLLISTVSLVACGKKDTEQLESGLPSPIILTDEDEEIEPEEQMGFVDDGTSENLPELTIKDRTKIDVNKTDDYKQKQQGEEQEEDSELVKEYKNNMKNIKIPTNYKLSYSDGYGKYTYYSMDDKEFYLNGNYGGTTLELACDSASVINAQVMAAIIENGNGRSKQINMNDITKNLLSGFEMMSITDVSKQGVLTEVKGDFTLGGSRYTGSVTVGDNYIVQTIHTDTYGDITVQTALKVQKSPKDFGGYAGVTEDARQKFIDDVNSLLLTGELSKTASTVTSSDPSGRTDGTTTKDVDVKLNNDGSIKYIIVTELTKYPDNTWYKKTTIKDADGNIIDVKEESDTGSATSEPTRTEGETSATRPSVTWYKVDENGEYYVGAQISLNENVLYDDVKNSMSDLTEAIDNSTTESKFNFSSNLYSFANGGTIMTVYIGTTKEEDIPAIQQYIEDIANKQGTIVFGWL